MTIDDLKRRLFPGKTIAAMESKYAAEVREMHDRIMAVALERDRALRALEATATELATAVTERDDWAKVAVANGAKIDQLEARVAVAEEMIGRMTKYLAV
jgi:hypothetical protein